MSYFFQGFTLDYYKFHNFYFIYDIYQKDYGLFILPTEESTMDYRTEALKPTRLTLVLQVSQFITSSLTIPPCTLGISSSLWIISLGY